MIVPLPKPISYQSALYAFTNPDISQEHIPRKERTTHRLDISSSVKAVLVFIFLFAVTAQNICSLQLFAGKRADRAVARCQTTYRRDCQRHESDRECCLDAEMDDYLAKPINHDELMTKLLKWLPADGRAAKMIQKDQNGQDASADSQS